MRFMEAYIRMLEKKEAKSPRKYTADTEKIRSHMNSFFDYVSLRHYVPSFDADTLFGMAGIYPSPLFFDGKRLIVSLAEKAAEANERMRREYGSFGVEFSEDLDVDAPFKELASWCALFPEKAGELFSCVFSSEDNDGEDAKYLPVLRPYSGCQMGDEAPIPLLVKILNASTFIYLMDTGRSDLATQLLQHLIDKDDAEIKKEDR